MDCILTHGLRPRQGYGGEWFDRVTNAIKGRWPVPTASAGTRRAQHGLGISGEPYYFYASRADRRFGSAVFLLGEVEGVDWPPAAKGATPFDSGGMWFGKIATDPPLNQNERRDLFEAHDVPLVSWRPAFETYIGTRYTRAADYVRGDVAAHPHPRTSGPTVIMGGPNESRAWTWEVRVPHQLVTRHLKLRAMCLSEENLARYLSWLWDQSALTPSEKREIDKRIEDYAIVLPTALSAADTATEWLVQQVA